MRVVSTRVLPVPAPASTRTGPSRVSTAWRCSGLRPCRYGASPAARARAAMPDGAGGAGAGVNGLGSAIRLYLSFEHDPGPKTGNHFSENMLARRAMRPVLRACRTNLLGQRWHRGGLKLRAGGQSRPESP